MPKWWVIKDRVSFRNEAFSNYLPPSCNPIEAALDSHSLDTLLWQHPDEERSGKNYHFIYSPLAQPERASKQKGCSQMKVACRSIPNSATHDSI